MKKILCFITALLLFSSTIKAENPDWGATGHRTIGKIADNYLKGKTKRKIAELLNGESLALVSTFGDDIKSDKRYNDFYTWHYVNMPFGVKYEDSEKNTKGDLVTGIEKCKSVILDESTSKQEKVFYLKLLVHFMGDLHQPMHVGRKEDKGGNTVQVKWFGSGTNLHSVWDSKMIEHYNMTYTELAENANKISKEQVAFLQQGTVVDWVNDTQTYAIKVYASAEVGEKLGYNYMYTNFEMARSQLQKGGIRLAKVLNDLFA
ncbi:MAG: S1/P1 nuclease [Bacteroidetes bacterium]|nr:S1/P1 nuclease [Bacteroidota bacterium]